MVHGEVASDLYTFSICRVYKKKLHTRALFCLSPPSAMKSLCLLFLLVFTGTVVHDAASSFLAAAPLARSRALPSAGRTSCIFLMSNAEIDSPKDSNQTISLRSVSRRLLNKLTTPFLFPRSKYKDVDGSLQDEIDFQLFLLGQ